MRGGEVRGGLRLTRDSESASVVVNGVLCDYVDLNNTFITLHIPPMLPVC